MAKMKLHMCCLLMLLISGIGVSQSNNNEEVQIVLLAGQSNMVGAGNFDELSIADKQRLEKIASRVWLSYNGKEAQPLSYFDNKPSAKYNFTKRFGPELFMGLTLAEANPNKKFLLIKRALGGTSLYGAWNPNWSAERSALVEMDAQRKQIKLYNLHLEAIKKHIESLKAQGRTYKFIGLAWMQGEKDTNKEVSAKSYKINLEKLIENYRKDLKTKNLHFVIGQVNVLPRKYKPGVALVRKAQLDVAKSDIRNSIVETSMQKSWEDYPKHPDDTHYNTVGQTKLGEAFAKALHSRN